MKIFVSAGDFSGDIHGALLVEKLKELSPNLTFYGVGGEKLRNVGVQIIEDTSSWSAIGIFDALPKVPGILLALRRIKRKARELKLDGIVFIDCPAFNVLLAKGTRELAIPSVYFFPPSQWNNNVNRAKKVGEMVDKVIAPFRRTAELYEKAKVPVLFSGHPLLDEVVTNGNREEICKKLKLDPQRRIIGILPGSREQEIKYLLPVQLQVAERLYSSMNDLQFVIPIAKESLRKQIQSQLLQTSAPINAEVGINHEVMQCADLLLLASGTATLEAALYEVPMVIIYKISPWSWRLERPFMKGTSFAGLPNLIADRKIVPELIQEEANTENIVREMEDLLKSAQRRQAIQAELRHIRGKLGSPGVMERVAREVLEHFQNLTEH